MKSVYEGCKENMREESTSIQRVPVRLPLHVKALLRLEQIRDETKDTDILIIAKHYEMLAREHKKTTGYKSLYRDRPKEHPNWKHFERIYYVCRMKDWDAKLYLEGQFHRSKDWIYKGVPQPMQMYSVMAMKHFTNYLGNIKQMYKHDTNQAQKKKGRRTRGINDQVMDELIRSIEIIGFYMEMTEFEDKERYKAFRVYQSWQELSPFYLWSIPWFHNILHNMGKSQLADECRDEFMRISESTSIQEMIKNIVPKLEEMYNIPQNIDLS